MAQQPVNIGTVANDGTGDSLRVAFDKLNDNDAELYAMFGGGETAAGILEKLLTVDGPGSGLNADLLDGLSSAAFASAAHAHAIADVTGLQAALDLKLAVSSYTAADVLAKLLTVDGSGSGIDADLLDGMSSAAFATAVHAHAISDVTGLQTALDAKLPAASYTAADVLSKLLTVDGSGSGLDADLLDGFSSAAFATASHSHAIADITGLQDSLDDKLDASEYTAADVLAKLLTVDGSGSGLDADLLDGQSSAAFAASSHTHAIADVTDLQSTLDGKGDFSSAASVSVDSEVVVYSGTTGKLAKRATGTGLATLTAGVLSVTALATFAAASHTHAIADVTDLQDSLDDKLDASEYTAADVLAKLLTVDGASSGLDADLLDGMSSAAFAAASHSHAISDVTGLQDALDAKLASASYTAADVLAKLLTVDGSGSGIDADLLDGQSSAAFAAASHSHAISDVTGLQTALDAKLASSSYTAADVLSKLLTVDGSGSGIDADLLDGISSAGFFQTASVLLAVDGTVGAPAYSFASDPDTGLLRLAANVLGFSSGGTEFMRSMGTGAPIQITGDFANATSTRATTGLEFGISSGLALFQAFNRNTSAYISLNLDASSVRFRPSGVVAMTVASAQMQGVDGSQAAPIYSWSGDTDTGMYRIGANQIGVSCGNNLVLDVAAATFAITATTIRMNTTTATTIGAAGGASALPATPLGYLTVNVGGTAAKIPYYNT